MIKYFNKLVYVVKQTCLAYLFIPITELKNAIILLLSFPAIFLCIHEELRTRNAKLHLGLFYPHPLFAISSFLNLYYSKLLELK